MTFEEWYEKNSDNLDDKEVSVAWNLMKLVWEAAHETGYSVGYDEGYLQGYDKGTDDCPDELDWM